MDKILSLFLMNINSGAFDNPKATTYFIFSIPVVVIILIAILRPFDV